MFTEWTVVWLFTLTNGGEGMLSVIDKDLRKVNGAWTIVPKEYPNWYGFEDIGFISNPKPTEHRTDIIQLIEFGKEKPLIDFCKVLQAYSPVESYLTPVPDEVVGYDDKLIMAGGSFIEGSTIELSADGPLRPPYVAYMQGGLNYAHVKIALKHILEEFYSNTKN